MGGAGRNSQSTIHVCAAEEDLAVVQSLEKQLARIHVPNVRVTHAGKILPGTQTEFEQRRMIDAANVIVLLLSADFLADREHAKEAAYALARHETGEVWVVPVLCRACLWQDLPYAALVRLPHGADGPTPILLAREPHDTVLVEIAGELLALLPGPPPDTALGPFPGLAPFDEARAADFFGRELKIDEALKKLVEHRPPPRWLQIEGPSGVGKSSFARAGLLPAIRKGKLAGEPEKWVTTVMRPGPDPLTSLAEALVKHTQPPLDLKDLEAVTTMLEGKTRALATLLRQHRPDGHGVLLLIDQLEEAFTLARAGDAAMKQFDALLAEALADEEGPLVLVTTIRSDFVARMAELPALDARLSKLQVVQFNLGEMEETDLRAAIEKPAARAQLSYQTGLVDRIVHDAGTSRSALPLVAHVLQALYLAREGRTLTMRAYAQVGGVGGALAQSADAIMDSFDEGGRTRARNLLLRLVKSGRGYQDIPQTAQRDAALGAAGGGREAVDVLTRLSGGRIVGWPHGSQMWGPLVVVSGEKGSERVDLIHDTLIQRWAKLRVWIEEEREALALRDDVEAAARIWEVSGRQEDGLPKGAALERFRGAVRAALQQRARDLLEAAEKAEKDLLEAAEKAEKAKQERQQASARRQRLWTWGLLVVVLGLVVFAVGVVLLAGELEASKRAQIQQANVNMARMVAGTVLSQLGAFRDALERTALNEEWSRALENGDRDRLASLCEEAYERYDDPTQGLNVSQSSPFNMWFVLDNAGIIHAQFGKTGRTRNVGKDYHWRDYFLGAQKVAAKGLHTAYVSSAFKSENDDFHKFAVSVPIYGSDRLPIGVLVAGLAANANLGSLELDEPQGTAVLVAPRDRERDDLKPESPFLILRHPPYVYGEATGMDDEHVRAISDVGLTGDQHFERPLWPAGPERVTWSDDYRDPVAKTHPDFQGSWLAGFAAVGNTGMVVIVQTPGTEAGSETSVFLRLATLAGWSSIPLALFLLGIVVAGPKRGWPRSRRRDPSPG